MATLLLTAAGTAIGGPLGGAIGALAGRQIDAAIIGTRQIEGPRLKDLAVQTSSYGSALPLHFGTMRAAGSVIWATDLQEHATREGSKGRPTATRYSYTASFAVALASRPVSGIGRVWADGNLLRGAAGDLKVGGAMRVHTGYGDQPVDPLIAQAEGIDRCPAFRNTAYVVFEDLELADFGNRIPSLTFEVIADSEGCTMARIITALLPETLSAAIDTALSGFSVDQGTCGDILATLSDAIPLACVVHDGVLDIRLAETVGDTPAPLLPQPAATGDGNPDDTKGDGWTHRREPLPTVRQCGVRYYDPARDYQPGLQRGIGRSEAGTLAVIELPAAIDAAQARWLAEAASQRASRPRDTMRYRVTEIGPATAPGAIVRVPVATGLWRIEQWEWQQDGVMLDLVALRMGAGTGGGATTADPGRCLGAIDLPAPPTRLVAFELPWDGIGDGNTPALFAGVSGASAGWRGAALFATTVAGDAMRPLGGSGQQRAIVGKCESALSAASPLLVDRSSTVDVRLAAADLVLADATLASLLDGANRALIGAEVIQFMRAEPLGDGLWRLSGLLRGRGGSEGAIGQHAAGEDFVLLDDRITTLDPRIVGEAASARIAAIGPGDAAAVSTPIAGAGTTCRPLAPVHGAVRQSETGGISLTWVRRARGAWVWADGVDVPLNEDVERWTIGYGDAVTPAVGWETDVARLDLSPAQTESLLSLDAPPQFHIRQSGRAALSRPLTIFLPD
ncbi:phage tail protein [Novosphingobium sp. EMRT-2]|uniref:phage tail protein n=1 Tax=Novosphingobium sp. EMRT-2 TaxID=2571749 RepID=UPI0010BDF881|nr:phage tail protein [Novosphingobium sp. EMRT-2]QCI93545.1 hypothetical protein FA702_08215 [Novosphingobium sp. EMRT-2]